MSEVLLLLGYGGVCIICWEIVKPHADKSARAFRRWLRDRAARKATGDNNG